MTCTSLSFWPQLPIVTTLFPISSSLLIFKLMPHFLPLFLSPFLPVKLKTEKGCFIIKEHNLVELEENEDHMFVATVAPINQTFYPSFWNG